MQFANRGDAGRELAARLARLAGAQPVVLGLPRGGVVVAAEVADALHAPLDVLLVRKVGAPGRRELAIGAVSEGGVLVTNGDVIRALGLSEAAVRDAAASAEAELDRRTAALRGARSPVPVADRTVMLVDDGIATGATVRAAIRVLRRKQAAHIVVAVPVGPSDVVEELSRTADDAVCLNARVWMRAVGSWYRDFSEVTDDDVVALLRERGSHESQRRASGR